MAEVKIRFAERGDLPRLTEIYNHYVINTAITFDLTPFKPAERTQWFEEHTAGERHRMVVAEKNGLVIGYAYAGMFRERAAYDTTVETSIYCADDARGHGVGTQVYAALFEAIAGEDIRRIVAGITLPNEASIALHERFGFKPVGVFTEVGRKFGRYWDVAWFERPLRV